MGTIHDHMAGAISLNIHTDNFSATMRQVKQSLSVMAVLEVLGVVRKGSIEPLSFCPDRWAAELHRLGRSPLLSADAMREASEDMQRFFVVLPDGRWQPDPAIFALTPEG